MTPKTLAKTHFTNFHSITVRGDNRERKTPPNLLSSFTEIEIFSDCPHKTQKIVKKRASFIRFPPNFTTMLNNNTGAKPFSRF